MAATETVRILAIETIGTSGTVAALHGQQLLAEVPLCPDQRSAQSLAPAIRQLLDEVSWRPRDVTVVAVLVGPGSFTGLRVGVTTAKVFARAVDAAVIGIGSLQTCAAQLDAAAARCWVAIDAGRQQQFAVSFVRAPSGAASAAGTTNQALELEAGWFMEREPAIVDNAALGSWLIAGDLLTGPGLSVLANSLPAGSHMTDDTIWQPRAATVGRLAALRFERGGRDDLLALTPYYVRRSAAEEKWLGEGG